MDVLVRHYLILFQEPSLEKAVETPSFPCRPSHVDTKCVREAALLGMNNEHHPV